MLAYVRIYSSGQLSSTVAENISVAEKQDRDATIYKYIYRPFEDRTNR